MEKNSKKPSFANYCLHILGILLCILPPMICTLCYFPLWKNSSEKTVCGGAILLLILCALPLYKDMKRRLSSAASYVLWLIMFLLFLFLSRVADEMTVISFFGFAGNLLGAICFWLNKRGDKNNEE